MAELDYEVKRSGLCFAAQVKLLVSEAPDTFAATTLQKAVHRLDSHYGFSSRDKKLAIRQYIEKVAGHTSIPELTKQFGWHKDAITRLVNEMAETDEPRTVEYYDAVPAGPSGRGRRGRRIRLIPRI